MATASITETPNNSFRSFFFEKFATAVKRVEGKFLPGAHLAEWAAILQSNPFTSLVSARKHLKTTIAQGYIAWRLLTQQVNYEEGEFMAYLEDLAAYHLRKLKRYIKALPECFKDYQDLTQAEGIIHYGHGEKEFICTPSGILTFKRGRHPDWIIADDILRDPQKKLDITQLQKITTSFFEEVMSMPKYELHVFGTPQDRNDLFAQLEVQKDFFCRRYPAIISHKDKVVLWPEFFPYERLINIRDNQIGAKAFDKEYMCRPVRASEGFLQEDTIDKIIERRLKNFAIGRPLHLREYTYAGFDIGKKTHPSHLAIFGKNRKGKLVQIHSKWMDGWEYTMQVEYIRQAIKNFKIGRLEYDDTRAEFEGFREQGGLPAEMKGVAFTAKNKFAMATAFDKLITQGSILLLDDQRQKRQLLNVDNDLNAVETEEGHGDCFFSICLAIKAAQKGNRQMIYEIG
jgi:hypothetical protein